ncbi:MAG TPA: hypothetical protein VD837_06255 [Terriglobales bacterium]|nr:hypothetical protein [Terriglobales bacterium]
MKTIAKILLAALAYVIGTMLSGAMAAALHLPAPSAPPGTTPGMLARNLVLFSPLLIAGAIALSSGLGGRFVVRFAAVFAILYVTVGLNTIVEAAIFSNLITGGIGAMSLHYVLPCAFAAAVLAGSFGSGQPAPSLPRFSVAQWAWRAAVAWLAFPAIYWTFGMCVAPLVTEYYRAGVGGLHIPPIPIIVSTQLLRSPLFLIASLPAILLWTKSRRSLFLSLGIAHAVMVGLFGLAQAYWLPNVLRIAHSIEITFDSFAYAGVLVLLFTRRAEATDAPRAKTATAAS